MSKIDLRYISAHKCVSFLNLSVYDYVSNRLNEELGRIQGYLDKYDHPYVYETDVSELKLQQAEILAKLELLKAIK